MKRDYPIVACLVLCAGNAFAAPVFERSGGMVAADESGKDLLRRASGDYYMVGGSYPDAPPYLGNAMGQQWDINGSLLSQTLIGSANTDVAFGVSEFSDGITDDLVWAIHTTDFT